MQCRFEVSSFVYVDGTTNAQSITDRDTYYLQLMADNGYVAVSADYNDFCGLLTGCSYLNMDAMGLTASVQKVQQSLRIGPVVLLINYVILILHRLIVVV